MEEHSIQIIFIITTVVIKNKGNNKTKSNTSDRQRLSLMLTGDIIHQTCCSTHIFIYLIVGILIPGVHV